MVRKFSCQPLLGRNAIRVVQLELTAYQDLPDIKLIHTELHTGLPFTALSYVWGSEIYSDPLMCDGGRIRITKNLAQALLHLQTSAQARYIWIDAVCIDQKNVNERNSQVILMKDI